MQPRSPTHLVKLQDFWDNPTSELWLKIYSGLELHKEDKVSPEQLEPLVVELNSNCDTKKAEEYSVLAIAGDMLGKFFISKVACLNLLQNLPNICIPHYLREDFFSVLTNINNWSKKSFAREKEYQAKEYMLNSILKIKDKEIRQNALWQSLCPTTSLGAFFAHSENTFKATTLWRQQLMQELAKELTTNKILLSVSTDYVLTQNTALHKELSVQHPAVYAQLVQCGFIKETEALERNSQTRFNR